MTDSLDFAAIDAMRDDLIAGGTEHASALFRSQGVRPPRIVWNPDAAILPTTQLPFVLRHWQDLHSRHGFVAPDHIDPFNLRPALGYILLLDVLDSGADYRYRLYGTEVARIAGFDMTGKRTSQMTTGSLASHFYLALYRAQMVRREPVYTWHEMPVQITINSWDRVVMPLCRHAGGPVVRLLSCNVPGTSILLPPPL